MKKMRVWACMMLCAGCMGLLGCGSDETSSQGNAAGQQAEQEADGGEQETAEDTYQITYQGADLYVNEDMAEVIQVLGEPDSYFESESCAFQGMDKVYDYGSVVINTYPENEADYILTIELKDDMVETPEGIAIGSAKDKVLEAYGTADQENSASLSYVKGHCTLSFIMENDVVSAITYTSDRASE